MTAAQQPIRACSFNVRYDNAADEYDWDARREAVLESIRDLEPALLGVQEPLPHQYDDLREGLEGYDCHGVGRRDGTNEGEFVPVAWRAERLECLESGEFWLSDTPAEPSVGWDGDLPRVTTWVRLRDRTTDTRLWVANTHLSHRGTRARLESARLLRRKASERHSSEECDAVVLTGDFNCSPGSPPYRALTMGDLRDARKVAGEMTGPAGTFHGFSDGLGDRIDYVFVSSAISVRGYRTLERGTGVPRSDHLPIVAELEV